MLYPKLPDLESLKDYKPKVPLRVYTSDNVLIGEFGEERRNPVRISQVPLVMQHAILAAEDDGFYSHFGVDIFGVIRAAFSNITSGGRGQGASTITMQVARNYFLSRDRTFIRKFNEILLAIEIEMADFRGLAEARGFTEGGVLKAKAGQIVEWLKADFDLGHGHAMAIYALLKGKQS